MGRRGGPLHGYLMRPVNMIYADADRQRLLVARLKSLADSLDSPVTIDMYREREEMMFGSKPLPCSNEKTVLSSREDVSPLLDHAGFAYERVPAPRYEVAGSSAGHIVLANGLLARCYALHGAPERLRAGWIYGMFGHCDFVRMFIDPVSPSAYLQVLRASERSLRDAARVGGGGGTGGAGSMAAEMRERVLGSGSSRIVSVRVVLGVMGADARSLAARSSAMLSRARGMRVSVRRLPWADKGWLRAGRTDMRVETGSLHPLFPFISSELYERGGRGVGGERGHRRRRKVRLQAAAQLQYRHSGDERRRQEPHHQDHRRARKAHVPARVRVHRRHRERVRAVRPLARVRRVRGLAGRAPWAWTRSTTCPGTGPPRCSQGCSASARSPATP